MQIIKGDFAGAYNTFSQPLIPSVYRGENSLPADNWHMWSTGFQCDAVFAFTSNNSAWEAYKRCSPLSSIINRKAQADLNGKKFVMNNKDKEATNDYADKIRNLLRKPNFKQNQSSFLANLKIYLQIFGYCPVYCEPPAGMDRINASSMWILPPQYLQIEWKSIPEYTARSINDLILSIKFSIGGKLYPIALENIFFFTDVLPGKGLPTSRTELTKDAISNIIAAMDSRGEMIRERGAGGIISPNSKDGIGQPVPLKPDEKLSLQKDWRQYGTGSRQNRIIISNASINWTRISMDVAELKLMEEVQDSSKMLCDEWGYPPHLLGLIDPTFNNQNTAEKGLYQNTIIPEAQNMDDQLNEFFNTAAYKLKIVTDFSHLPVLQENKVELGNYMFRLNQSLLIQFQNNIITYNEWRIGTDLDPVQGMDIYYSDMVQAGKIFGAQPNLPREQGANSNQSTDNNAA